MGYGKAVPATCPHNGSEGGLGAGTLVRNSHCNPLGMQRPRRRHGFPEVKLWVCDRSQIWKSILSSLGQCVSSSVMTQASEGKESPKGQSMGPALGGLCTLAPCHLPSQLSIWRLNFLICEVGSFAWPAYASELVLSVEEESWKRFYRVRYRSKRQVS